MIAETIHGTIADNTEDFFAPALSGMIDSLIGEYQTMRQRIERVSDLFEGNLSGVIHFFLEGNRKHDNTRYSALSAEKIFVLEGAIAALNAQFWDRALKKTDVLDYMPQARRSEWWEQIREMNTPEFTEESVRATLTELLLMRPRFFAERVDGIFRALSREHVTNRPEGFFKRMIVNGVMDAWGSANHDRAGYINDLRLIVAKFMGRPDEPNWSHTSQLLQAARRHHGERHLIDGGALSVRCYIKGTVHIEVHPEMAYRLNQILAQHNPKAIPSKFRTPPKRASKQFDAIQRPLPFEVLGALSNLRTMVGERLRRTDKDPMTLNPHARRFDYGSRSSQVEDEAGAVLAAIGGVPFSSPNGGLEWFEFDYNPSSVIDEIVLSGCIPDRKSHQLYPTPKLLAHKLVELAEIGESDKVLEPSAGLGNIARLLPQERTQCVELAPLHCQALVAQGFAVQQADFLEWSKTAPLFDRIVMNPPFSEGRALAHLEAAAELVKTNGRLVAILPNSARNKWERQGWKVSWSEPYANAFVGTSAVVTILCAARHG